MAAIMIVIPLLVIGFVLLARLFPVDIASVAEGVLHLKRRRLEAGRISYNEMIVAAVMIVTILSWVFLGKRLGLAGIAMLAVAALFACRVVTWQTIEEYVNWGIILMYGGAIALASALEKSGAAAWIAGKGLSGLGSPFLVITVISLVSLVLTECISNAAVIAILVPIGLSLAHTMGIDPRVITLAITLPAGLAYCLPMGTPANAIVYSSGFLKSREMIVPGLMIMTISWLLFLASAWFVWPLLGLKI
jgi:sodium-dependent dicarboxylate transporter 2/3/5